MPEGRCSRPSDGAATSLYVWSARETGWLLWLRLMPRQPQLTERLLAYLALCAPISVRRCNVSFSLCYVLAVRRMPGVPGQYADGARTSCRERQKFA